MYADRPWPWTRDDVLRDAATYDLPPLAVQLAREVFHERAERNLPCPETLDETLRRLRARGW